MNDQDYMSRSEVAALLAMMAAYHRRRPGEADVLAWQHQLRGLTLGECQAAVAAHSATSNEITPADIRERVRRARERSAARAPKPPPGPADRSRFSAAARRGMAEMYQRTGWTRSPEQAAALAVVCPVADCRAEAGVICWPNHRTEVRQVTTRVHPSRIEAGREALSSKENPA
ncbi:MULTISPECIES: hypothetical protein [unclassified Crossiella]|uniref:hypothetical protein n=1 Tax=unclassified Crossiella TaxID=2620835 RepID=UPI001FFE981F|nr:MULTISPECIES: hypothetical protein [unclassified Crossiella]MCK2239380.1 hypothetical protein [Crossiella sp. S99.2]MCK2252075.1 hypothetical protein [Crossiella sp. S99.1]